MSSEVCGRCSGTQVGNLGCVGRRHGNRRRVDIVRPAVSRLAGPRFAVAVLLQNGRDLTGEPGEQVGHGYAVGVIALQGALGVGLIDRRNCLAAPTARRLAPGVSFG